MVRWLICLGLQTVFMVEHREGDGVRLLNLRQQHEMTKWEAMSAGDKIADWAQRHEYSIIVGAWALSLVGSGAIISRNK
jgi:hypothetical protein